MVDKSVAIEKSLKYFDNDKLAAEVFVAKYALTSPDGDVLEQTPDDLHRRLAKEFARIEKKYPNPYSEKEIYEQLKDFKKIVLQGSPMFGIGNPYQVVSLSNCFVAPPPLDSYGSILRTDEMLAQISKRRGGVGTDLSNIRPANAPTQNAARTSTGIGPFMERFSNTIREVGQNSRRGALMLTISIHHPEIQTFINIKKDLKKVTGANLSIRLTDEFLRAVKNDEEFELRFPVNASTPKFSKMISAKELWSEIVESAWGTAEPGLLFWDNILKGPADCYEKYRSVSTNPCGELPLSPLDSCRLMIVNLLTFVSNPFTRDAIFNFEQYNKTVMFAQKLMDDMIDLEIECIEKIIEKINKDEEPHEHKKTELDLWTGILDACRGGRRTGLGITALGDAIAALSMRYGSKESISFTEEVYKNLGLHAYKTSVRLAEERGAFPDYCFETEKDNELINRVVGLDKKLKSSWEKFGRRNVACTTTAPVGTVSLLTQTTSGIEPAFEVVYKRRRKIAEKDTNVDFVDDVGDKWQEYEVYHHQFQNWMKITKKTGVENSPYWKARANDVDWAASVEIQAVAQKWVCHSISKTCNLPNDATRELVSQIYLSAWESGCKGFTVYRDGCRAGVLVSSEKKEQTFTDKHAPKRPKELVCDVFYPTVKGEKWTFFVGKLNDRPYEIMGGLSKYISIPKRVKFGKILKRTEDATAKYDFHYDYEIEQDSETIIKDLSTTFENATQSAFTRTISLALRHGTPTQYVVEQLLKGSEKEDEIFSFSKAVSRVLKTYIVDGAKPSGKACGNCGSGNLVYLEGCASCQDCGHSKC